MEVDDIMGIVFIMIVSCAFTFIFVGAPFHMERLVLKVMELLWIACLFLLWQLPKWYCYTMPKHIYAAFVTKIKNPAIDWSK